MYVCVHAHVCKEVSTPAAGVGLWTSNVRVPGASNRGNQASGARYNKVYLQYLVQFFLNSEPIMLTINRNKAVPCLTSLISVALYI